MSPTPTGNDVLDALPAPLRAQWLQQGRVMDLRAGDTLVSSPGRAQSFYFPISAVLAWVSWLGDGASTALAVIGHEGMISTGELKGLGHHLLVLFAGTVLQLPASLLHGSARTDPSVHRLHTDSLHALMAQASETAICNQHHSLQQRLMRLLQAVFERVQGDTLRITQAQLAELLGTRRERVSQSAAQLHRLGVIRCTRGRITVLDRTALVNGLCGCSTVLRLPREGAKPAPSGYGSRSG